MDIGIDATWDGFEELNRYIARVSDGLANLDPLVNDLVDVLVEDNREARLAGEDRDGGEMVEVIPYRGRKGDGPPLVPEGGSARLITEFDVQTERTGSGEWIIVAGWPTVEWLRYHTEDGGASLFEPHRERPGSRRGRAARSLADVFGGERRLPVRDPRGLRPIGQLKAEATIRQFLLDLLESGGPVGAGFAGGGGGRTSLPGTFEAVGGRTVLGAGTFGR